MYERIVYLTKNGYLPFILRFSKVTVFHIVLECLISTYALELFALLTCFCIKDPTELPQLLAFILSPSIIVILLSLLFGMICSLYFMNTVYKFLIKYVHKRRVCYEIIKTKYCRIVASYHLLGLLLYITATTIIPWLLTCLYPQIFIDIICFRVYMAIIGFIFGLVFNLTGYYRNRRLMWHLLLKQLDNIETRKKIKKDNFIYVKQNIIGNIISIFVLVIIFTIIMFNIHPELLKEDTFKNLITEYNFLIVAFVLLVSYYIRIGFRLLYSSKNQNVEIFPNLSSILNIIDEESNTNG